LNFSFTPSIITSHKSLKDFDQVWFLELDFA
jgi:hypothetical protein